MSPTDSDSENIRDKSLSWATAQVPFYSTFMCEGRGKRKTRPISQLG